MSANLMSLARSGGKFLKLFGDRKMVRALPYLRRVAYLESHGTEFVVIYRTNGVRGVRYDYRAHVSFNYFGTSGHRELNGNNGWGYWGLGSDGQYERCSKKDSISGLDLVEASFTAENFYVYDIALFALGSRNALNDGFFNHAKIGTVELKVDDVIVRDIIPVIDILGRPCFYDQAQSAVSADDPSRFFYNQGTGEFTWGELDSQTT